MEGDVRQRKRCFVDLRFLSTPSGWRATREGKNGDGTEEISIHALRVEGDLTLLITGRGVEYFYPRPPGGGRPRAAAGLAGCALISIHALRVEGDGAVLYFVRPASQYFYPRPPGGGRRGLTSLRNGRGLFLSTPSGWRATYGNPVRKCECQFLSTPSGWRATGIEGLNKNWLLISIHALRVGATTI